MKRTLLVAAALFLCAAVLYSHPHMSNSKESTMQSASGPFDVKLTPKTDAGVDPSLGRMAIDKQFHGDLEAVSKGQMLSASTTVKDSGAYVAIEKVTGTLHGRKGTFILQHLGLMTRGTPTLNVAVVPDSGTDELTGLSGKMTIIIAPDGKHSYQFDYTVPDTK